MVSGLGMRAELERRRERQVARRRRGVRGGWLLLWGCVLLVGMAFAPDLTSLAYHNQGEVARMKWELVRPPTADRRPPDEPGNAVPWAYQMAVAHDPGNFLPYLGYGQWLLRRGDPVQAASWLERALALNPTHRPAYFYLGLAYLEQGMLEQALAQFRHSDVLPSYLVYRAWRHVEETREQGPEKRDWTAAERYYRAAALLRPDDLTLWGYLADFYSFWANDSEKALTTWREAAQAVPGSPAPHRRAAELLWRQWKNTAGAIAELEEAARLAPGDAGVYLSAADILRGARDEATAEAWLRRGVDAAPGNGEVHFRLGELYLSQGRAPQAIKELLAATAAAPEVVQYQARLAQALQTMGLTAEAIAAYQRVLELAPDDAQARKALEELTR